MRVIKQRPGKTLRKYIQRFSQVHNKILNIPDNMVITAFKEGVTNHRMLEKLGIHTETLTSLTSALRLKRVFFSSK